MPVVADHLAELLEGMDRRVLGIGISLPGTIDPERGVSVDSPVIAGWDGVDLAPYLESLGPSMGGAPIFVGNDADVLARSERLGHAATFDDLIVVKASTGLGLGIIAEGRVVSGHLGAAGEIGHTKVDAAAGRPCRCGDTGCLETIAAGWALLPQLAELGRPVDHIRDLTALAVAGDPEAKQLLRESGRRLGEPLAIAINLLNPQAIVIGGDMAAAFDVYAAGVRESVYARASALATRDLQFLPATFGDRAGMVGCASMALDQVLSPAAVDAAARSCESAPESRFISADSRHASQACVCGPERFHRPRPAPVTFPAVACPSGRRRTPRKRLSVQADRGFKSHRHRQPRAAAGDLGAVRLHHHPVRTVRNATRVGRGGTPGEPRHGQVERTPEEVNGAATCRRTLRGTG